MYPEPSTLEDTSAAGGTRSVEVISMLSTVNVTPLAVNSSSSNHSTPRIISLT